jgi:hypothetical protein
MGWSPPPIFVSTVTASLLMFWLALSLRALQWKMERRCPSCGRLPRWGRCACR